MDKQVKEAIYQILDTIGEVLEHLQQQENLELRQTVASGRQQVTQTLENALSCSLEHRIEVQSLSDEEWLVTAYRIMDELNDPFQPKNALDKDFLLLLDYVWRQSKQELLHTMLQKLDAIKVASEDVYQRFINYFSRFPLWGTLDPDKNDYTTLELRAEVLKRHSYDFLWLYRRLEDYLSKRSLWAILLNWAILDTNELTKVKSIFPDYWEPDVFPHNQDDVLVDIGAFIGDSIEKYVQFYGEGYKKIYAYEISEDSYAALCQNTASLHDVITKRKGVGRYSGKLFVAQGSVPLANQLCSSGDMQQEVEVVALDEDIQEAVTFLKMDIEGAEQDALLGCEAIIRTQHPKLAICTYHGYEDIWKIPLLIDSMYPHYQFYLRHYGGNLIPTEFALLCKASSESAAIQDQ